MNDDTPGDYYRRKAELARLLSDANFLIKQASQMDGPIAFYGKIIAFLERRLEAARYVGD